MAAYQDVIALGVGKVMKQADDEGPDAAAIHRVHFDVENVQSGRRQYLLQSAEGVIFDMLVTDRIV